ncbi:phage tail sheath family protein [Vallitalea maricola]|uniref:Phage tail sheath family protein n=1 Tax=Vallitalea maricola TaxID=3074433 RepID=A0ACB5UIJ5_9FIRM|nr:phage tail sheath family protein [Vallitalea sp. AN17-2]
MGGTWTTQNKVRPGVYINFQQTSMETDELHRGIITMPLNLDFGPEQEVIEVSQNTDTLPIFGEELYNLVPIREGLKRAEKVLVYRLNTMADGSKAAVTEGNLTATAKYTGTKGNDLKITIEAEGENFNVKTFIGTKLVDIQQGVKTVQDLQDNEFVVFSGSDSLTATAGASLTGGTNGTVASENYTAYREAIEVYYFNTCALYDVTDIGIKDAFKQWIKRLRDDEGNKVVLVAENYSNANYEGIISVKNGVVLEDGTTLEAKKATAWVAGATAAANTNKSLTYDFYDGAVDVDKKYNYSAIESAINDGEFLFTGYDGKARVEYDINTLHTYTKDKGRMFRKNRVIRTLDAINNDITKVGNEYFIGKISNNEDGRNLLKNEIIKCLQKYQNNDSITNLDTGKDVQVLASTDTDVVVVRIAAQPVDGMEKLYMTVEVK